MATTKIWAVKDSVARVIDYASNPEKTELDDLAKAIHYAADGQKTKYREDEKTFLVSTINCAGDPYKAMSAVREHFGSRGSVLAFHAYQSFKPGEVTPEICHKIGVELAENLWGKEYQVLVATHMNKSHLHNHIIINPISIVTGKKLDSGYANYFRLREASDEICRQNGLSVIKNPKAKTPRNIYFAEKAGEPTRYNLMRSAIDEAKKLATNGREFLLYLHDRGYDFDRNEGGKYPKIKPLGAQKWTRLYHLGEAYSLEEIDKAIRENSRNGLASYGARMSYTKRSNLAYSIPRQHWLYVKENDFGPLLNLVVTFVYLLGGPDLITPEAPAPRYHPITPEMREATRKCEMYSRQAVIMGRENINTKEDADAFLLRTERKLLELERKRKDLYNSIRREDSDEVRARVQKEIHALSAEIKPLRRQISDIKNVLERSGVMREMVEKEEQMRREQLEREYLLRRSEVAELRKTLPNMQEKEEKTSQKTERTV